VSFAVVTSPHNLSKPLVLFVNGCKNLMWMIKSSSQGRFEFSLCKASSLLSSRPWNWQLTKFSWMGSVILSAVTYSSFVFLSFLLLHHGCTSWSAEHLWFHCQGTYCHPFFSFTLPESLVCAKLWDLLTTTISSWHPQCERRIFNGIFIIFSWAVFFVTGHQWEWCFSECIQGQGSAHCQCCISMVIRSFPPQWLGSSLQFAPWTVSPPHMCMASLFITDIWCWGSSLYHKLQAFHVNKEYYASTFAWSYVCLGAMFTFPPPYFWSGNCC
jgi:hypothetical protein